MSVARGDDGDRWRRRRSRATGARLLLVVAGVALLVVLARVQVFGAGRFEARARDNHLRPFPTGAARGTILDRDGRVLAHDIPGHDVVLLPAPEDSITGRLERLAPVLELDSARIEAILERRRRAPGRPITLIRNATDREVARLEENRFRFPEVVLTRYPKRHYPEGRVTAHAVGYVGEISKEDLALQRFQAYAAGRRVGKGGIERSGEASLAGLPGIRYVITDARGGFRGWVPDSMTVRPRPGTGLTVTLDLALQRDAAALFPEDRRGAFVALDPMTGAVLALYSRPTLDPNRFVNGIDPEAWERLRDDRGRPVLNRAIAAVQPPASTWKPIVAAMALDAGIVEPTDTMPIPCRGGMMYAGRYYRCWGVHGEQDLLGAIQVSCDVYFYQLGLKIGLDGYLDLIAANGLAAPSGVDIPGERPGTFPSSRDWWETELGYVPQEGEVLSLVIGQGPQGLTPLRLAQLYTAFVRPDGTPATPWLVQQPAGSPTAPAFHVSSPTARIIREALGRVVGPGGTAAASHLDRWDLRGKTGTAQTPSGPDHAWFAGFAGPRGAEPAIVAVAFVENGEHGSDAARYVATVVDRFLARRFASEYSDIPEALP
ncbi:MAG: penicillin-binding transpeptidase domain-containing protein [Candidatus Longimicrobiales bacterium M2_2A_002]